MPSSAAGGIARRARMPDVQQTVGQGIGAAIHAVLHRVVSMGWCGRVGRGWCGMGRGANISSSGCIASLRSRIVPTGKPHTT